MKRRSVTGLALLFSALMLLPAVTAGAQGLQKDLTKLVETPTVSGHEEALAALIRAQVKQFSPRTDNMGNVYLTLGSGAPRRVIVTPMDEPGYVVSGITPDGYLRVQRLPQQPPNAVFDLLYSAQPVEIYTRAGKWVPGVVAGLSVHLQPGRRDAPRVDHPDEMYIDIGAASAAEVKQAGVDLLDPLVIDRKLYELGSGRMAAPSVGDRFGCAAVLEMLRHLDAAKLHGTLTVAFLAQEWLGGRGLDRILDYVPADEMIYVGRLLPQRGRAAAEPQKPDGSGVLIGVEHPAAALTGLPQQLEQLAGQNNIPIAADGSAPVPHQSYVAPLPFPERFAHLGVAVRWPVTPAELVDSHDVAELARLLELYAQGSATPVRLAGAPPLAAPAPPRPRSTAPAVPEILARMVESYGVSGQEAAVRETVQRLLPPWAKPETDDAGNLWLHVGSAKPSPKTPRIVFVAHMDEIGFVVRSIAGDGRLELASRGGGASEFFAGHAVLVHTAGGMRPGVLELPAGWEKPDFEWPRGRRGSIAWRADVGARSPAEAEQLGIKVGDFLTVPKKYRRLFGRRANGRSFDDRVGCTALIAAVWALGPSLPGRDITLIWSTEEEVGLRGAAAAAKKLADEGRPPDYVFAVDTFVSSDSPLESKRFGDARVGHGFVSRAVDNSNITPRKLVDRLVSLARANNIPVQYGVTGGGNDGNAFLRYGSIDVALGWPLRYSHSAAEVVDTRDVEALGRAVAMLARHW